MFVDSLHNFRSDMQREEDRNRLVKRAAQARTGDLLFLEPSYF
jgi:hypothetical protein